MSDRVSFRIAAAQQPSARGAWPNVTQVEAAKNDAARLAAWSRSLPAADNRDRSDILRRIVAYLPAAVRRARLQPDAENF
jgi:hypothetical protein